MKLGDRPLGTATLRKAAEGTRNNADYWYDYGIAMMKINLDAAGNALDKAIDLQSANPDFLEARGDVYAHAHHCKEALREYDKALKLEPNDGRLWTESGVCDYYDALWDGFYGGPSWPKCQWRFQKAIDFSPDEPRGYMGMAACYSVGGVNDNNDRDRSRYEKGADLLRKAISLDKSWAPPHIELAHALHDLGFKDESKDELDEAVRLGVPRSVAERFAEYLFADGNTHENIFEALGGIYPDTHRRFTKPAGESSVMTAASAGAPN